MKPTPTRFASAIFFLLSTSTNFRKINGARSPRIVQVARKLLF